MGCVNSKWPDLYGHYREAKFTQTKHHWWWKANQVFDVLEATRELNCSFVFLEEDHLLAPDALHLLNLMERQQIVEKVIFSKSTSGTLLSQLAAVQLVA